MPFCSYIVGMPPPPAQMTIVPFSSSHLIGRCSKIRGRRGGGDDAAPAIAVRLERPAVLLPAELRAPPALVVAGADELRRVVEGGVVGIDLDHGQDRRERNLERQQVAELLLDEVADHPLRLGGEDVQRVRLDLRVRGALQREQADLRPVAVARARAGGDPPRARAPRRRPGRSRAERPPSSAHRAGATRCRPAPRARGDARSSPRLVLPARRRVPTIPPMATSIDVRLADWEARLDRLEGKPARRSRTDATGAPALRAVARGLRARRARR